MDRSVVVACDVDFENLRSVVLETERVEKIGGGIKSVFLSWMSV